MRAACETAAVTTLAPIRRAELVGALSLATDLGVGLPLESGLRGAVLAADLARTTGLGEDEAADAYALAHLRFIGCTADSHTMASFFGDEIAFNAEAVPAFYGGSAEVMRFMLTRLDAGGQPLHRLRTFGSFLARGKESMRESARAHCEVARMLAESLGYREETSALLTHIYDRYDGKGPLPPSGHGIPAAARVMHVARDAAACQVAHGVDAAIELVGSRAGKGYDPEIARAFCRSARQLCARIAAPDVWELALDAEPGSAAYLAGDALEAAFEAMADFADLKSAYTVGHSREVARLAEAAAVRLGLSDANVTAVRWAGLVHDLGRVAVPVKVWDKPGALTTDEREQVRLHPYHTERVLRPARTLRSLGRLASLHHERLDGSGYHRGCTGAEVDPRGRVLAVADAFAGRCAARPHRPAAEPRVVARQLREEARAGRLDGAAVDAVLEAAGQPGRPQARGVAGLTDREIEVLRLLAGGLTTAQLARRLGISAKTADHHIQHIYTKAGVSTRAAATVFAVRHHLLDGA